MDVAATSTQPVTPTTIALATIAPTATATPTPAPTATDTVQISQAAHHAHHSHGGHRTQQAQTQPSQAVPGVDQLVTNDEAKLSNLASTYSQAFQDRLQALGYSLPTPASSTPASTGPDVATNTTDSTTSPASTDTAAAAASPTPTATPTSTATATTATATDTTATTSPTGSSTDAPPTTAAGILTQLNATLGKLQSNANTSIELD
jgi:hypothetical protein